MAKMLHLFWVFYWASPWRFLHPGLHVVTGKKDYRVLPLPNASWLKCVLLHWPSWHCLERMVPEGFADWKEKWHCRKCESVWWRHK
jgi:hypothetical protein